MGSRGTEVDGQSSVDSTPEDVASLYAWANLQGAKYRDYSASRREYRAQVRYRAAKAMLERELKAQAEAERAAELAERDAFAAEAVALSQDGPRLEASRLQARHNAETAAKKAADERVEAARRAEAAAHATMLALREEHEIAEAHASAQEKETRYTESELRRRELAGPQPYMHSPAEGNSAEDGSVADNCDAAEAAVASDSIVRGVDSGGARWTLDEDEDAELEPMGWPLQRRSSGEQPRIVFEPWIGEAITEPVSPAWLKVSKPVLRVSDAHGIVSGTVEEAGVGDTLQGSRERVAARWFALKGAFEQAGSELRASSVRRTEVVRAPILVVFSLAGGVGKTSLVATLGRTLAAAGEKALLADTTADGVLPFYFGAKELRLGAVSAFPPPVQGVGAGVSLGIFDANVAEQQREGWLGELLRNCEGQQRLLLDLSASSSWLLRQIADLHPMVLVPITPDMNSVISVQAVEKTFRGIVDAEGNPLLPFYVVNQFDASQPLHLDVREVFRRKLGDRLLRVAIRRSSAVSEALAEGMTVVEYAPSDPVSQDYAEVAAWLRGISPAASVELNAVRWSEL